MRRYITNTLCALAMGSTLGTLACDSIPEGRPVMLKLAPHSLEGVDIDGDLVLDREGQLVLDARARVFFDHFLTAEGEVDDEQLHALVWDQIDERLDGDAAVRAWETFFAYLDYRSETSELLAHDDEMTDEQLAVALAEIRARTTGDALGLAEEETSMRMGRALSRVLGATELSLEERKRRAEPLRAALGRATAPDAPSRLLSRVHAALEGLDPEDVARQRAVLEPLIGAAGTERWLALEQRRSNTRRQPAAAE